MRIHDMHASSQSLPTHRMEFATEQSRRHFAAAVEEPHVVLPLLYSVDLRASDIFVYLFDCCVCSMAPVKIATMTNEHNGTCTCVFACVRAHAMCTGACNASQCVVLPSDRYMLHITQSAMHTSRYTLHVARCTLQAEHYTLHATGCRLQAAGCRLQAASCALHVAC